MTKGTDSAHTPLPQSQQRCRRRNAKSRPSRSPHFTQLLLAKSISCIGVFSILSSNLVLAQTESSIDIIVPTTTRSSTSAPATPKTAPAPARIQRLRQRLSSAPVRRDRSRSNVATPAPRFIPRRSAVQPPIVPSKIPARPTQTRKTATNPKNNYSGAYIDPTDYKIGATRSYEAPNAVVLSERSTGCKAILRQGQGLSGVCGTGRRRSQVASGRRQLINRVRVARSQTPNWASRSNVVGSSSRVSPIRVNASGRSVTSKSAQGAIAPANTPRSLFYYNRTPRPVAQLGKVTGLMFPLTIPAPITSFFGWRIHPITGNRRFHTGTDIGASQGIPVLAAHAGNVAIADFLGGYGLTVILESKKSTQQTLYAHMSEIFVQPGESVEQGTVIGRVGSTGNSTGPNLHFETRTLTSEGWIATDPGMQIEDALAHLVESLRTAQSKHKPANKG